MRRCLSALILGWVAGLRKDVTEKPKSYEEQERHQKAIEEDRTASPSKKKAKSPAQFKDFIVSARSMTTENPADSDDKALHEDLVKDYEVDEANGDINLKDVRWVLPED